MAHRFGRSVLRTSLTALVLCAAATPPGHGQTNPAGPSPYLLISAGDVDGADSDFLAVIDLRRGSSDFGKAVSTLPTGMKASMPHHMEYAMPPAGEPLFLNAHHHEMSLIVDVSDPRALRVVNTFKPPAPLRFPHDYYRTPKGTRLVGFLRSEGKSISPAERVTPGNHGGIAEYTADGKLLRQTLAGDWGGTPVRPYAFALLPEIDRLVVTSAAMMEAVWADVVQIYRYSDFALLETMALPRGKLAGGREIEGSERAGFGPRILADRSVFLNSYGCTFYRLSDIGSAQPRLETFFALDTPPPARPGGLRGACGIPIVFGNYWLQPVGKLHAVVVLDVANPSSPREVFRLDTPQTFNPHWLARDPLSNRLVVGAELGGEQGFYILRFDEKTGSLSFDPAFNDDRQAGYISLKNQVWPHGPSGPGWGHAALFMPPARR